MIDSILQQKPEAIEASQSEVTVNDLDDIAAKLDTLTEKVQSQSACIKDLTEHILKLTGVARPAPVKQPAPAPAKRQPKIDKNYFPVQHFKWAGNEATVAKVRKAAAEITKGRISKLEALALTACYEMSRYTPFNDEKVIQNANISRSVISDHIHSLFRKNLLVKVATPTDCKRNHSRWFKLTGLAFTTMDDLLGQ